MRYYTGIGSRTCPDVVQMILTQFSWHLERADYVLRSGGATGADKAFEAGVFEPRMKEILRPGDSTPEAEAIAATIHPAWERCKFIDRKYHGRNVMQLLGRDLKTPSELVVAWTPRGSEIGGSRTVLVLARERNIPVFNLGKDGEEERLMHFLYDIHG